ncbi:acyltransferase family protein [Micromonospora chokoriensis]|uniref:Peptidoglycan/LPS O-acetylase OafA/YrhL, contains acyltransferase and SGNH-hydrolase domains n=1 Tax=Micromonospora chokoriensis TaxID=356851 RepID=A0A1C4XSI9_9ACTN|nr:acyltransferase [Micromonospora chokoriensis]SCF11467.1 Peptidoglycan/LPS O-acetylase OafA/YrhL, contains acyltransferase and SGNH-hydrolase domains [Micromonospora chokoriensis]
MQAWFNGHRSSTLQGRYSAQHNAFGVLRLAMACGVIVAHAGPLGFAEGNVGATSFGQQSDLGTMCLYGFFLISGYLITDSALRSTLRQYVRARILRVFPGLWACLLVTAFVFAPVAALYENGNLDGFWGHPEGPFDYVLTNIAASMEQFPISGLLADTPYGQVVGGPSAFDGSLWTLRYDLAFYGIVGILVVTSVLHRAPRAVLVLTGVSYALILADFFAAPTWSSRPPQHGAIGPFPLIGAFAADWTLMLGFLFLLGAAARLYAHRVPMNRELAVLASVVLVGSLWLGGFFAVGLPAFAYLVLFAAVALPKRWSTISRTNDYTYGLYIYGFPVQQMIALFGGARFGMIGYILLSLLGALVFAVLSWHLVERPALGFKTGSMRARHRLAKRATTARALPIAGPVTVPQSGSRSDRGGIGRRRAGARHSRSTKISPTTATATLSNPRTLEEAIPFLAVPERATAQTPTAPTSKPASHARSGRSRHSRPTSTTPR